MQSGAGRRAISSLTSKLHPPMPLSHTESQQLLNLLTTSFRNHLDREHPITVPEGSKSAQESRVQLVALAKASRPESSYASAHEHIESILSHPLISRKPRRRASGSDVVDVLKDPLNWFMDQIALGTADIPKATTCLRMWKPKRQSGKKDKRMPATVIADWLRTSGTENSTQFIDAFAHSHQPQPQRPFISILLPMLAQEKNTAPLWRWLTRSPELRMEETDLSAKRITAFRIQLLKDMVHHTCSSTDEGLLIFLRVLEMYQKGEHGISLQMIGSLGSYLVSQIENETPTVTSSTDIYETFISSAPSWLGRWHQAVDAMLWLHHPTRKDPYRALAFIQDPKGAASFVPTKFKGRSRFLVRLCLGTAQQLLADGKPLEAQVAMNFTQQHFADIVLSKPRSKATPMKSSRAEEIESIAMLDCLLPT